MKKVFAVALLAMFGFFGKSQAAFITKTISSTTFVNGFAASDVLLLNPRESMNYTLSGGATGTVHLERSVDMANWTVIFSSSNNRLPAVRSGTEFAGEQTTFFRFRASTMTHSGSFVVTLQDNDDLVGELKNNKKVPSISFTDDRIIVPRLTLQPATETAVSLSTSSVLTDYDYPRSFAIVTSSGGPIVMLSSPAISTTSARVGDIFIIYSTTATIIYQDDGTFAGSALELGAATRSLGVGDMLGLIYRAGKWWEMFFANN